MTPRLTFPALLVALCLLAAPAFAADEPMPRTVNTSGESVVYVRPDEAVVGFGIESFADTLDKAKQQNEEASAKLLKAIKALGIEEKHVQTDTVQIEIHYKEGNHPTLGIEGYFARRSYSVTLKDIKLLEKLVDTALKNGANQLMGFEYRTSELRKYRDQARQMAIKAAKEKAEALSTDLACKVGSPRTINEGGFGYFGTSYRWGGNSFNLQAQNAAQVAPGGEGGDEATMPLGQIGIRANVSVTFDLVPAGEKPDKAAPKAAAGRPGAKDLDEDHARLRAELDEARAELERQVKELREKTRELDSK
jgi:hypothetical protein